VSNPDPYSDRQLTHRETWVTNVTDGDLLCT
jgi:hypothetical protein